MAWNKRASWRQYLSADQGGNGIGPGSPGNGSRLGRVLRFAIVPAVILALVPALMVFTAQAPASVSSAPHPTNQVLVRALRYELGQATRPKWVQNISSGIMYSLLEATGEIDRRANGVPNVLPLTPPVPNTQGCSQVLTGAGGRTNTRVNQDCSLRRQAEEVVVVNPMNPSNLIAGQNDSRIGYNKCGYDWSLDGGSTWGDQIPPFYQFSLMDGHTADACSDPTATFDGAGNAYVGGILFDLASPASAIVVAKSNNPLGGTFYHTPDSTQSFQTYRDNPLGVVASDNDPNITNDKEFIVADSRSPGVNRVYATWTRFNANTGAGVGGNSPIYFSQSTDGGAHWSTGIEISGANRAICTDFSGETNAHACDQDQGSDPVVANGGTIYVSFGNGNTPTSGLNQHLIVSCPPSRDCSNPANWTSPAKISDDYGTQPTGPDPTTGCPGGRQCLPPNGYRLDDFVEGALSAIDANHLYFTWADYRNGGGTCPPNSNASQVTPPCNNDVFYTFSTDQGAHWSAANNLTAGGQFGQTAQWMPWSAVSPDASKLWVAFYDRSYGNCEFSGCNDITLAQVVNPTSGSPTITYSRLTTASMPNLTVANNPVQAGFLGDYMWVSTDRSGTPYVVWADTRGLGGTTEEDIYFTKGP